MWIRSIELNGYERFSLNAIRHFKMHMTSEAQIIAGTNGSGKSSLLAQLSPLPPSAADFAKNGSKFIEIHHNANDYAIRSTYHGHSEHSFMVNGVEQNYSKKEPEQRALVKQHFGLTPAIFDLLTGVTKFTEMPRAKRQEWLMTLSGMDFDYIMKVFKNARDKVKEYTALSKGYALRENDEVRRLEQLRRPEDIAHDLKETETEVLHASNHRVPLSFTRFNDADVEHALQDLKYDSEEVLSLLKDPIPAELGNHESLESFKATLMSWHSEHQSLDKRLTELYRRKHDIDKLATASVQQGNLDQLEKDHSEQTLLVDQLRDRFKLFDAAEAQYLCDASEALYEKLGHLFLAYPDNREKAYSRERFLQLQMDLQMNTMSLKRHEAKLTSLMEHKRHLGQTPKVDCPKCNASFIPGHGDVDVGKLDKDIEIQKTLIEGIENALKELTVLRESFEAFKYCRTQITSLLGSSAKLKPLHDLFSSVEAIGCNASILKSKVLGVFHEDCELARRYSAELRKKEDLKSAIDHATQMQSLSKQYEGQQQGFVDQEIESLLSEKLLLKQKLDQGKVVYERINKGFIKAQSLKNKVQALQTVMDGRVRTLRGEAVDRYLSECQRELSAYTEELSRASTIKTLIDTLAGFRKESESQLQAAKTLVDSLSPTDGLIAEFLNRFLKGFVNQMNRLIGEIWTYDLVILPCMTDNGDIDYRFPVQIGNSTKTRPDIAHTSSAQTDVINLAFRLIAIDLLGLENFPFFIDEPPPTLDELHRLKMITFIKNYLYSGRCSQMFMVSHYVANHGMFNNAEFCVLDSSNIVNMPGIFNRHVKLG